MNEIYTRNLETLKEKYGNEIYEKIRCIEDSDRVITDKSLNGESIIAVKGKDDRLVYLNSRYNDDEFTDNWINQYKGGNYQNIYIIFGTSNFLHINKLIKETEETNVILIYEPDKEIFSQSIRENDICEILNQKRVILSIKDINDNYAKEFIAVGLSYQNINLIKYCCMPNYNNLYIEDWKILVDSIMGSLRSLVMTRNTYLLYSKNMVINSLYNYRDFIHQHSLNQLAATLRSVAEDNIPVILVSAGPSLDKNIEDLRLAVGKAFIVAVDTALKPMLNKGIIPDLVVTIDMVKYPILFMHTKFRNIAMLVTTQSNKELLPLYTGKRFYFSEPKAYMSEMYKSTVGEDMMYTESGGSVANNAFSAIRMMGFKNIILIGQDLAYPNNRIHAKASFGNTDEDNIEDGSENTSKYFEVEDIYGNRVLTEDSMDLYRRWFEEQIIRYEDLEVIDATEGGAKIKGTEIMTLKDAINLKCHRVVNVSDIIAGIEPEFNPGQQERLDDKFRNMGQEIVRIEKRIEAGIKDYEKLVELFQKNKQGTKDFKAVLKRIEKTTRFVENDAVLSLAGFYSKGMEYGVLGRVFNIDENGGSEIKDIAEIGIKMLKSYIDALHCLEEDIVRLDKIDSEELKNNIESTRKSIKIISETCNSDVFDNIDSYMKDFYDSFLQLINRMNIINKNYGGKIDKNYYELLMDKLPEVVQANENSRYHELVKILSDVGKCIETIEVKCSELC